MTIALGRLAVEALNAGTLEQLRNQAAHAIRYYLSDKDAERAGWLYPGILPGEDAGEGLKVDLTLDGKLWDSLAEEAALQGVAAERLAEHAVLYFIADREAGRVPARIRAA